MMKFKKVLFFLPLFFLSSLFSYDSYEHSLIGDKIELHGIGSNIFTLENGVDISFGDLIAMGDYYGRSEESIAVDFNSEKEITDWQQMESRFMGYFDSLAKSKKWELEKILKMIGEGKETIQKALSEGKSEEEAYKLLSSTDDVTLQIITRGRYGSLASTNFDHFGGSRFQAAKNAFIAGYNIAMKIVKDAQPEDVNKLAQAYCVYGFACHYLTDSFSSGHMRVPRFELLQDISGPFQHEISGLLAFFQHKEDGCLGINVSNVLGSWKAFGDSTLFISEPEELNMPVAAVQKGIDNIYNAFMKNPVDTSFSIEELFPTPTSDNFSPLFKFDEKTKKVVRRSDIADINCNTYTDSWHGISTLVKLYFHSIGHQSEISITNDQLKQIKDVISKATGISHLDILKRVSHSDDDEEIGKSSSNVEEDRLE